MEMKQHELANALIEALGLPKHVTSLQLNMAAGEATTVLCEYFTDVKRAPMERAIKLLKLAQFEDNDPADNKIRAARHRLHKRIDLRCEQAHLANHRATTEALHYLNIAYSMHLINTKEEREQRKPGEFVSTERARNHA